VDALDDEGFTPLCHAVLNSNIEMMKLLLEHGANVNIAYIYEDEDEDEDEDDHDHDHGDCCGVRSFYKNGYTPLIRACIGYSYKPNSRLLLYEVVETLIAHDADIFARDSDEHTALFYLSAKHDVEEVRCLIIQSVYDKIMTFCDACCVGDDTNNILSFDLMELMVLQVVCDMQK
jgi:ankyrin repeat protein